MLGFKLSILSPDCDENTEETLPDRIVTELSKRKGLSVYSLLDSGIVVSSDTIVYCENKVCEKPKSKEDAFNMLSFLAGKTHEVYTGVFIKSGDMEISFYDRAEVTMYKNTPEVIRAYIDTKEPLDKAGSYGINGRGAVLIERINGDYYTIMGLPAARVYREIINI